MMFANSPHPGNNSPFHRWGYLQGIPVLSPPELKAIHLALERLLASAQRASRDASRIIDPHKISRLFYEICLHPTIVEQVCSLLGEDAYLWSSHLAIKAPRSRHAVPWHQDDCYFSLHDGTSLAVFLAFDDVGPLNGAVEIMPGSHRNGLASPGASGRGRVMACRGVQKSHPIELRAGEISVHHGHLIHRSPPNLSANRRAAYVMHYAEAKAHPDRSISPRFSAYPLKRTTLIDLPMGTVPAFQRETTNSQN